MNKEDKQKTEDLKKLVVARLDTLPPSVKISVGSEGSFDKKQLIQQIENNTEIGRKIVEIELEYLRRLKEGILYASIGNNH